MPASNSARPDSGSAALSGDVTTRINLSWLLWLRWGAAAAEIAMIGFASRWLGVELELAPMLLLVAGGVASNVACALWLRRAHTVPESLIGVLMTLDVLLLTGLFYFSGGAANPFSSVYLVNLALAAIVLRPLWTWALVVLSMACFAGLFLVPLDPAAHSAGHAMGGTGAHLQLHLEGMWLAFAFGASFIVYFVRRVTRALAERERELHEAHEGRERAERLASLATLAAGAAHELSTPLSVIAVAARELDRELAKLHAGDSPRSDVRLIREQVERCREILLQMAADAGESTGEDFAPVSIDALIGAALVDLADAARVEVSIPPSGGPELVLPVRAVGQALRALVKNALDASAPPAGVRLAAHSDAGRWRIEIEDDGTGMTPEVLARAFEPFFTTKPPGKGMGLGLFLARDVVERVGGDLRLGAGPVRGTIATVDLPAHAPVHLSGEAVRERWSRTAA